jgi:hypothetical protein
MQSALQFNFCSPRDSHPQDCNRNDPSRGLTALGKWEPVLDPFLPNHTTGHQDHGRASAMSVSQTRLILGLIDWLVPPEILALRDSRGMKDVHDCKRALSTS